MDGNKSSVIRMVLILLAVASVVLTAVQVIKLSGKDKQEDAPQADLSGYGTEADTPVSSSSDIIIDDDATVEMDSIPNGVVTSGGDTVVSGADAVVSAADAE